MAGQGIHQARLAVLLIPLIARASGLNQSGLGVIRPRGLSPFPLRVLVVSPLHDIPSVIIGPPVNESGLVQGLLVDAFRGSNQG